MPAGMDSGTSVNLNGNKWSHVSPIPPFDPASTDDCHFCDFPPCFWPERFLWIFNIKFLSQYNVVVEDDG